MIADEQRVIVGVSGSVGSLEALRVAVLEGRRRSAVVHAILAWTPPGGELGTYQQVPPSLMQLWVDDAEAHLQEAFEEALGGIPEGVSIRPRTARGDAARILVTVADRPGDLLVVGAGHGGLLRRAAHGSVSRFCVSWARCPVLVVPEPALLQELRRHRVRAVLHRSDDLPFAL